jgi:hypothetical protein
LEGLVQTFIQIDCVLAVREVSLLLDLEDILETLATEEHAVLGQALDELL